MKLIKKNLRKVLTKKSSLLATIISILLIGYLFLYFKNTQLIIGNLGIDFYITELSLDISIALLFGLFIGTTTYKILHFTAPSKKDTIIGGTGSFFGILVSGCPACSITLASYLGFAGILSVFPFYGIELKILSFIMLLYVVYTALKTLETCKMKKIKITK